MKVPATVHKKEGRDEKISKWIPGRWFQTPLSNSGLSDRKRFKSIYWGLNHVITLTIAVAI